MKSDNYYGMLSDIQSEPKLLTSLYADREKIVKPFVKLFSERKIKRIYLTGSGSPLYVAIALQYAAIKLLHVDATAVPAMLLNNHQFYNTDSFKPEEMLLICPAESGNAKGQVYAARRAKAMGIPVVCTTWNLDGVLAKESDIVLLKPEREKGMPTTKGQVMAIYLVLLCMVETAQKLGTITDDEYRRYLLALYHVPENVRSIIETTMQWFEKYQDLVMASPNYRIIAYGANIATAEEATIKFTETHTRPSMFYELEESMHGPVRALKQGEMMFLICAEDGPEKERMKHFYRVMKKYSNACVMIQNNTDPQEDPHALRIQTDNVEFVNTIEFLVPFEVLAFCISDKLGLDTGIHEPFAMMKELETSFNQ